MNVAVPVSTRVVGGTNDGSTYRRVSITESGEAKRRLLTKVTQLRPAGIGAATASKAESGAERSSTKVPAGLGLRLAGATELESQPSSKTHAAPAAARAAIADFASARARVGC